MGRSTYETVLGFDSWPFEGKRVIVLSTTIPSNNQVHVVRSVSEAQQMLDGGRTIQAFLAEGLIDEITVSIAPVILGRGRRLFGDLDQDMLLTLRGHHSTHDGGLLRATYDVHTR
jgi:dihydrofolate reductase